MVKLRAAALKVACPPVDSEDDTSRGGEDLQVSNHVFVQYKEVEKRSSLHSMGYT